MAIEFQSFPAVVQKRDIDGFRYFNTETDGLFAMTAYIFCLPT